MTVAARLCGGATLLLVSQLSRASDHAAVPVASAMGASTGNFMQMLGGLAFVLALIFALAWISRRFGGGALTGNAALRVVAGISVSNRERIILVQVGDTQLVVGVAPGRLQTLHVLDKPVEAASVNAGPFAEKLKQILQTPKDTGDAAES